MLLSTPCHTDTWAYLNQSLLISLITTFRGRACEFQQFHSILTPIIINTLNTLTAIMTVACLADARIKLNALHCITNQVETTSRLFTPGPGTSSRHGEENLKNEIPECLSIY